MTFIQNPNTKADATQDAGTATGNLANTSAEDTGGQEGRSHVNWQQRHEDSQSYYSRRETELRKEIAGLRANQDTGFTAPKTPEEMAAFKQENPEWFGAIETIAGRMAKDATEQSASRLAKMEKDLLDSHKEKAQAQLLSRHSDYRELGASKEFQEWIATKSQDLRDKVYSNGTDASAASEVFDYFKAERKGPRTKQTHGGSAADDVTTSSQAPDASGDATGPVFSNRAIAAMSPREFEAQRDEIMKAHRDGRIID